MDFQDFPMILGNLDVEGDHPPKMCAGLVQTSSPFKPTLAWFAELSKTGDS